MSDCDLTADIEKQRVILERAGILQPVKVWVLTVDWDGGSNDVYIHRTRASAVEKLTDIALEQLEFDREVDEWQAPPREQAIEAYFDNPNTHTSYDMEEREILP